MKTKSLAVFIALLFMAMANIPQVFADFASNLTLKESVADGRLMLGKQLLMRSWAYFSLKVNGKTYSGSTLTPEINKLITGEKKEVVCTKDFPEIGYKHTVSIKKIENGLKIVIESSFSKECPAKRIYIYPLLSWKIFDGAKYEATDGDDNITNGKIAPFNSKSVQKIPLKTNLKEVKFHLKTGGTLNLSLNRNFKSKFFQYLIVASDKDGNSELRLRLFQGNENQLFSKGYNGKIEISVKYEE